MGPFRSVVVAEEDAIMQSVLRAMLTWWGYNPVVTADGAEAWRLLQAADAPRLAMVDSLLPGIDGVEICRRVRSSAIAEQTYVLLLTRAGSAFDFGAALDAGVDDFLLTPINAHELRARVRAGSRIVRLQQDLLQARHAVQKAETADALTGALNRAAILDVLEQELAGGPTGILLTEIDRLDQINSSFGQRAGDAVLTECGRRIRAAAPDAAVGRYTGRTFLVVLPGRDGAQCDRCADSIRESIGGLPVTSGAATFPVTCTIGVATGETDAAGLLCAAEEALTVAKRESRESLANHLVCRGAALGAADGALVSAARRNVFAAR